MDRMDLSLIGLGTKNTLGNRQYVISSVGLFVLNSASPSCKWKSFVTFDLFPMSRVKFIIQVDQVLVE